MCHPEQWMTFRCSSSLKWRNAQFCGRVGGGIAALAWKIFKNCSDFVGVGQISNVGEKQIVVPFMRELQFFLK